VSINEELLERKVAALVYKTEINDCGVQQNRVLLRIHAPKRDGVTGERRKLHNVELHHEFFVKYN
jgi:hypothetical protein